MIKVTTWAVNEGKIRFLEFFVGFVIGKGGSFGGRHAAEGGRVPAPTEEEVFWMDLVDAWGFLRCGFVYVCHSSSSS